MTPLGTHSQFTRQAAVPKPQSLGVLPALGGVGDSVQALQAFTPRVATQHVWEGVWEGILGQDWLMTMHIIFNQATFAETLKAKRESAGLGVREAADQIGNLSASTISLIENGKVPDLPDFLAICAWINNDPAEFWQIGETRPSSTREQVRLLLAQDAQIDHEIIMAIDAILKLATEGKHG